MRNPSIGRKWTCGLAVVLCTVGLSAVTVAVDSPVGEAAVAQSGCNAVSAGGSSGWCGLYPGQASSNITEQGMIGVSLNGDSMTVQTQSAATGVVPGTSFACLLLTPASQITQRLQDTLCTAAGGVWLPFGGGSLTIDLGQYPQFENTQFTVQLAANMDANSANGDAFYNDFTVSSVPAGASF